jgi:sulfite exporter TauE/SafE
VSLDPGALSVYAAFSLGLFGSGHCIAMCGGIACALGLGLERGGQRRGLHRALCLGAYQAGRILSYAAAGAAVGAAAVAASMPFEADGARRVMHLFQAGLFVLLGLYLTGLWRRPLAALEGLGLALWNRLAPLRARLFPVRHPGQALAFGLLWGWLPCGLVYSALALALSSGSAAAGAASMLAFGLGTVPAMLAASVLGRRLSTLADDGWLRKGFGALMLLIGAAMGALTALHAAG